MIRKARFLDIPYIVSIYSQRNYTDMITDCKYTARDFYLHMKEGLIYVYENENNDSKIKNIIGFVLYYDHITWGYIEIICVDEKYRNKGIGNDLLNSVTNIKWSNVELCCHLTDVDMIEYFEKRGFVCSNQKTEWLYKKIYK